ncbi:MAG: hypothetical protein JHC33_02260 [Ignisphaera sp.]|nr:hypothetical protein [Ignisphaera sp.]
MSSSNVIVVPTTTTAASSSIPGAWAVVNSNNNVTWQTQPGTLPVDINGYLPSTEAREFLSQLLKNHCSEEDVKQILLLLFNTLSTTDKENIKLSPGVVTALLTFCIEKYA